MNKIISIGDNLAILRIFILNIQYIVLALGLFCIINSFIIILNQHVRYLYNFQNST